MTVPEKSRVRQEAPVLYTLLDAADEAGLITDATILARWRKLVRQSGAATTPSSAADMFELVVALDRTGALQGTWIEKRWQAIQSRLRRPI